MHRILLLGTGKIGQTIAAFLANADEYTVQVADVSSKAAEAVAKRHGLEAKAVDATDPAALDGALEGMDAVICALGFHLSIPVAEAAARTGVSYFDLTEDVAATRRVVELAQNAKEGQVFMPQCGLAPGFVSIAAAQLAEGFDVLDTVALRVGALPQYPANPLQYNITWSLEGLINEYCEPCEIIRGGKRIEVEALEGYEQLVIDGSRYEAFHTSGGLGTLSQTLEGTVRELSYKTLRYPGHRDLMRFLLRDLRLADRRELAHDVLANALPSTQQDVVVLYVAASGQRDGELVRETDVRKIYPRTIDGESWAAIQIATASGLCAVLDLHREGRLPARGLVRQEEVRLRDLLDNRFGKHFAPGVNALPRQDAKGRRQVA